MGRRFHPCLVDQVIRIEFDGKITLIFQLWYCFSEKKIHDHELWFKMMSDRSILGVKLIWS